MKNIKYILALLIIVFSGCADELNDELFHKYSYIINNGWASYEIPLDENNKAELGIYLGVNGTSENDKDITIEISPDSKILEDYNFDKYKNQITSYYPELPVSCYSFDKNSYTINKGSVKTAAIVTIDLNNLENVYKEYVLPVKIKSSVGEDAGPDKYTQLLANILFTNQYSGQYSGTGKLKEVGTNYTVEISSFRLYATSTSTCYMYAGNVTRTNQTNYIDYAIDLSFDSDGNITMTAKNSDLEFDPQSASMERKYYINYDDNRYYNQTTILTFKYMYKDLSSDEDRKLEYEGSCSISKKVLITDYPDVVLEE